MNLTNRPTKSIKEDSIYIVDGLRSPFGSYGGAFLHISIYDFISPVVSKLLERNNIDPLSIGRFFMGSVYNADLGQNPARQAAMYSGMKNAISTNVSMVCLSGLKAVVCGAEHLRLYPEEGLVVCVGAEKMSGVPYYLQNHRFGRWMSNETMQDGILRDGLMCAITEQHMITCTEGYLNETDITMEEIDAAGVRSHVLAAKPDSFSEEIVPIEVNGKSIDRDEKILQNPEERIRNQPILFNSIPKDILTQCNDPEKGCYVNIKEPKLKTGTSSKISDGASAVILATGKEVLRRNLKPLGEILQYEEIVTRPDLYITSIHKSIERLVEKHDIDIKKIDLFEISEAFSPVFPIFQRNFDVPIDRINISGGSVAIGHPLGATGNRLIVSLLYNLKKTGGEYGILSACAGGGIGGAMLIRRIKD